MRWIESHQELRMHPKTLAIEGWSSRVEGAER